MSYNKLFIAIYNSDFGKLIVIDQSFFITPLLVEKKELIDFCFEPMTLI